MGWLRRHLRWTHPGPNHAALQKADDRLKKIDLLQEQQARELAKLQGQVAERRLDRIERLRLATEEQNRRLRGE